MRVCISSPLRTLISPSNERIDGVFIGPYDLSLSLGFPAPSPNPHPEVEKVIQSILASAHAKGKKWQVFPPLYFCSPRC